MIKVLIIITLSIIVISLLGVSIGDLTKNDKLKENFSIVFKWTKFAWENYIYPWAKIGWEVTKNYIWTPLLQTAQKIRG